MYPHKRLHQQGYRDGYQRGLVDGLKEAADGGRDNGWDVGFEIGFLNGFIEIWLRLLKKEPESERKMKALSALNDMIRHFRVLNVHSPDYAKDFAQIQAKYRQVLSLLKVPVVVKEKEKGKHFF
jgi:hypothetical protein